MKRNYILLYGIKTYPNSTIKAPKSMKNIEYITFRLETNYEKQKINKHNRMKYKYDTFSMNNKDGNRQGDNS